MIIKNWRRVLLRAASMWCVYLAAGLQIIANAIPYAADHLPWWVSFSILIAAPFFRILSQGGLDADQQNQAQ